MSFFLRNLSIVIISVALTLFVATTSTGKAVFVFLDMILKNLISFIGSIF